MKRLPLIPLIRSLLILVTLFFGRVSQCDNRKLIEEQLEALKRDVRFMEHATKTMKEFEDQKLLKDRPIDSFSFQKEENSCQCDDKMPHSFKSPLESHSKGKESEESFHPTLAQSCKECHEGDKSGFTFESWMTEEEQWEKRLGSTDPNQKAQARMLLGRLYNGLVDSKNMPPLNEDEKRSDFYNHAGNKKFIEFLKTKWENIEDKTKSADSLGVAPNRVSVMDAGLEQKYRDLWPKVNSPKLTKILADPNLIIMDKTHMTPGYQDPSLPVLGERSTEKGFKGAGFANDSPFIDKEGHLNLWSTGFGIEKSANVTTFHFTQLPRNTDGSLQKIKVSKHGTGQPDGGPLYEWEFPIGTVSGEAIMSTDSNGKQHILEIRVRTKDQAKGPWAADIFRPYPTRASLQTKLREITKSDSTLASEAEKVLSELSKPNRLKRVSLGMHGYQVGDLDSKGATETLPKMSEALTLSLLKEPFKSSLGTEWDKEQGISAFAASTQQAFSIVPQNNNEGAVQVGRTNCGKCHKDANRPIRDFYTKEHPKYYSSIVAYANTPGDDQNLRFNIFDQTEFSSFGATGVKDNRKINPKLLPVLDVK